MELRRSAHQKKKRFFFSHHTKTVFLFLVGSFFFLAGILLLWGSFLKLPDFGNFQNRKIAESTKIYDRTGKILLYDVHQDIKRTLVPFDDISPFVKNAVVAIEDSEFYNHGAISPKGLARAIIYRGTRGGGSTITQQVIKITLLTDKKQVTRKIKEIILAFKLERTFTKNEILSLYLNEVPYGGNIYGIGEASKTFFGKTPKELSLAESAYLAAIPNAPTYYSPYGNHRDKLDERKNLVLRRMYELGYISDSAYKDAVITVVTFLPKEPTGIRAPHFVEWVKEYLADKYGESAMEENGYKVITTLDYELQKKAEDTIAKFGPGLEEGFNATNMALVAINPENGQVLSMVGSRDYFNVQKEGNFNVALAHRQPGSTFKPFVYATAFMKGYTPETTIFDLKTNFSIACDVKGIPLDQKTKPEECYMPVNYDGLFRGPISMRNALAQSLNVPAVKTLYLAGLVDSLTTARRMGIEGLGDVNRYGLTLVLGGGEVSLLNLTSAYGVFANDGVRNPTVSILHIEDNQGKIIEEYKQQTEQVIPVEIARTITNILADNVARTPEFGANSALYFPGKDVAVKTGTTNDFRDVWTIGYTPHIAVGMWAGNNDNSSMHKNIAGMIISPVWHAFMQEALKMTPSEKFIEPEPEDLTSLPAPLQGIWQGGEKYIIDTTSGKLATPLTPNETKGVVVVPEVHTILHWINKYNPRGLPPVNPQNDSQYALWEGPVRDWVLTQNIKEGDRGAIPTEYETVHTNENLPVLTITGIDLNQPQSGTSTISFTVASSGKLPLSRVDLFINGQLLKKVIQAPFFFTFDPQNIDGLSVDNTIAIVGYDTVLNKTVFNGKLILK